MRRKKKSKSKFIKPKSGLRPGGPTNQLSHVGVRYHQGYIYDKLRYTVLMLTQMSARDKSLVESTLKTITTAPQAMTLPQVTYKDGNPLNNKADNLESNGWACTCIDQLGKCYVVSYHGFEVAVFYKRQLHTIKLEPGDKHPECVLQDPQDAWMRMDLFGPSAKRANYVLTSSMNQLKEENKILNTRIQTLEMLNDKLEKEINRRDNESERPKRRRRK